MQHENEHDKQGYHAAKNYLAAAWDFHKRRIWNVDTEKKESRPYLHDDTHESIIFAIASVDAFFDLRDPSDLKTAANHLKEYKAQ